MKKLIIFDLDGTLLDTSRDIQKVLNASLKKFGLTEVTYEQTLRFVGNGARKLVERAAGNCDKELVDEVYADYSVNFSACDNALTTLYEGEDGFLTRLKAKGIKLAVVTNKPQKAAENVCAQHLGKYGFDCVVGGREGQPLKPDPSATLGLIEKYGFKKQECLFVGDGETDVATALNAGIDCVSVLWGFRGRAELEEAGSEYFAQSYGELEKLINNL